MDFPQRNNNGDGNDGPNRPPRKLEQPNSADEENNNAVDVFGDSSDLPLLVFLFMAAMLVEHFRSYYQCGC